MVPLRNVARFLLVGSSTGRPHAQTRAQLRQGGCPAPSPCPGRGFLWAAAEGARGVITKPAVIWVVLVLFQHAGEPHWRLSEDILLFAGQLQGGSWPENLLPPLLLALGYWLLALGYWLLVLGYGLPALGRRCS